MGDPSRPGDEVARHLLGHGAVGQAQHDHLRPPSDLRQVGHEGGTVGAPVGAGHVVGDHLQTRADEVVAQGGAHVAETDQPHDGHGPSASRSARTASRARLADRPAGTPQ